MKYSIEFQHKSPDWERPEDAAQDEEIFIEGGENVPIPNVGDSVSYMYDGKPSSTCRSSIATA